MLGAEESQVLGPEESQVRGAEESQVLVGAEKSQVLVAVESQVHGAEESQPQQSRAFVIRTWLCLSCGVISWRDITHDLMPRVHAFSSD